MYTYLKWCTLRGAVLQICTYDCVYGGPFVYTLYLWKQCPRHYCKLTEQHRRNSGKMKKKNAKKYETS